MEQAQVGIRLAAVDDAAALLAIYAPYVRTTAISFECEVPTVEEFARRIEDTLKGYPYLVALIGGEIVGYAYVSRFRERAAYDWAVETSIYVRQFAHKQGIGRALYEALERILRVQGVTNMNACIAFPPDGEEDEYLSTNSIGFHGHVGYRMVGRFSKCAYKFDRWYDMVWMEKIIGPHGADQPAVIPFPQIADRLPQLLAGE